MTEKEMESRVSLISAMLDEDEGYLPFEGRCLASLSRSQLIDKLTNEKKQRTEKKTRPIKEIKE